MNDSQRLAEVKAILSAQQGLSENDYQQFKGLLGPQDNSQSVQTPLTKVAFFDGKSYDLEAFRTANTDHFTIIPIDSPLDENNAVLAKGCQAVCLFVNDQANEKVIRALANMGIGLIALRCAGFNNVDLTACNKYNIDVVRVPDYSPHAVAEHAIALMLMLNRQLHRAYMRNRMGQFLLDGLVGFDMFGKTIGIVGTGKIGECAVDVLLGFGCQILAYDEKINPKWQHNNSVSYVDLNILAQKSDIISLHLPLTDNTYHLINKALIDKMKFGVMLINTSRGGLVDTQALLNGLKSQKIGSAGLDVYEEESNIFFHDISGQVWDDEVFARLMTFNNVVITSHQGFLTQEALSNIAHTTLKSISEYAQGKRGGELTYLINVDR